LNFSEGYTTLFGKQLELVFPDPWLKSVLPGVNLLAIPAVVCNARQKVFPAAREAADESTG